MSATTVEPVRGAKTAAIKEIVKSNPNAVYSEHKERMEALGIDANYFSNIKGKLLNGETAKPKKKKKVKAKVASNVFAPSAQPAMTATVDLHAAAEFVRSCGNIKAAKERVNLLSNYVAAVEAVMSLA